MKLYLLKCRQKLGKINIKIDSKPMLIDHVAFEGAKDKTIYLPKELFFNPDSEEGYMLDDISLVETEVYSEKLKLQVQIDALLNTKAFIFKAENSDYNGTQLGFSLTANETAPLSKVVNSFACDMNRHVRKFYLDCSFNHNNGSHKAVKKIIKAIEALTEPIEQKTTAPEPTEDVPVIQESCESATKLFESLRKASILDDTIDRLFDLFLDLPAKETPSVEISKEAFEEKATYGTTDQKHPPTPQIKSEDESLDIMSIILLPANEFLEAIINNRSILHSKLSQAQIDTLYERFIGVNDLHEELDSSKISFVRDILT
ncbi:MAG: hypothetical protein R3279_12575 [Putridiphycobacter sp.]|nr:hypothetical protein [Putridiphycobacter sp.]